MSTIADLQRAVEQATIPSGYEVTATGKVFSCESNWRGHGRRLLIQDTNTFGYRRVRLTVNGKRKVYFVHKLVAAVFLPPRPSVDYELRHLNGNKDDNCAVNLAWGTAKDNADDRERHGHTARGSRNGFSKLNESTVVAIRNRLHAGESQRKVAKFYSVCQSTVGLIARNETWHGITE